MLSVRNRPLRIGMVVGEASGDILGAGLMRALRALYPDALFEGVGGPGMLAEGFYSHFPQERLAVMGLVEPLKRLPELLRIRASLTKHFLLNPPDVFIGIDSPDFNLPLERKLKTAGIKTVHYVSPSVWAWRRGRLPAMARAVDLLLTLFPFEETFYQEHAGECQGMQVCCVGHTLADALPLVPDTAPARQRLDVPAGKRPVIALLPGSRAGEVARMGSLFLAVAQQCLRAKPDAIFLLPAANAEREQQLRALLAAEPGLPVRLVTGQSRDCMEASDAVLLASGTTALECMLLKKPMVVAYKLSALSFFILSRMIKVPFISLPNLLANERLVPEFLQQEASVENLSQTLLSQLDNVQANTLLLERFTHLHHDLRRQADTAAAKAVSQLLGT